MARSIFLTLAFCACGGRVSPDFPDAASADAMAQPADAADAAWPDAEAPPDIPPSRPKTPRQPRVQ